MNYYKLVIGSSYLRYVPGCRFVATNAYVFAVAVRACVHVCVCACVLLLTRMTGNRHRRDKTFPIHDGLVIPGGGTMVNMIAFNTER